MSYKLIAAFLAVAGAGMALTSPPRTDYVSYLGGTYTETVVGVAVDRAGSAYVAGNTNSPDFPITSTTLGTPTATSNCAFVTKFNAAGTGIPLSYCVANSQVLAFGIDANGSAGLARTLVFFSTPGAYQTQYGGGDSDVFAAKVDSRSRQARRYFRS